MRELLTYLPGRLNDTIGSLHYFMPEVYLAILFLLVLVTGLVYTRNAGAMCRIIAIAGMVFVLAQDVIQYYISTNATIPLFSNMLMLHHTAVLFKLIIDAITVLLLFYFAWDRQLKAHRKGLADLYAITIASVFGLHLMVMAVNLLSIYVAIEFVSLASYLMVAYKSEQGFSAGAGLRYVLFGAASSAVMLYGISLLYGFSGSMDLFSPEFIGGLAHTNALSVSFALVLMFAGLGFKLSFIPMHFWAPDVYQGAATPVTAYLSTLPKIAAFALLINFITPFVFNSQWNGFNFRLFLSVIGIITMIAGNFAAVMQQNVKRMLAYSSIGHTGFALMAVVSFSTEGISALIFYLAVYAVANIGALILASYFANISGAESMDGYRGLGFKLPGASISFVIILISLTGLPVTAGFIGKVLVFQSVYNVYQQQHQVLLLLLLATGALTTVVSLFYYIKIPLYLFLRKSANNHDYVVSSQILMILAIIIAVFLFFIGLFPDYLVKYL